ncbi:MAG: universal stress protein [Bacteroidetes bacterium]|nr:MAG: universal stress protein [Bacteroidota bacterium]
MFKLDNILICLDLTEMDESLIGYANFMVETFNPSSVTFIHVMDTYEIPEEIIDTITDSDRPLKDLLKEEIVEKVQEHYKHADKLKPIVIMEEGLTVERIVKYAQKNKTDLAVMGKKIGYIGEGGVVKKIIGLIPSSVLLISETSAYRFTRIMVRTNFASPSVVAFQMAKFLQNATGASIEFHNVYKLPYNYFPEQSAQAAQKLKARLEPYMTKKYEKFVKKYKLPADIPFNYTVDVKGDEAQSLYNYAVRNQVDLVITGTRLKSQLANIIMDSTSEKLAGVEKNVPVMIVKDVKEFVGFFKALFE